MLTSLRRIAEPQGGATAAEYALMVTLIALVIFVSVAALGSSVADLFQRAADSIPG